MNKGLLILPIVLLISEPVLGQVPIDPLRLPEEKSGSYIYTFSIDYTPDGREGFDFDSEGNPFSFETFNQLISFSISGNYSFNQNLSVLGNVSPILFISKQTRDFGETNDIISENNTDIATGLFVEYRLSPGATLDPRFSVGMAYPWTVIIQSQASLIKDPVILLTSLGYAQPLDSGYSSLDFVVGSGFVANDRVSFSGYASYSIPIGETNLPATSLSFRTGYNLDDRGNQDIGLRTTLSMRGGDTRLGISIEWGGRGIISSKRQIPEHENNTSLIPSNSINDVLPNYYLK